MANKGIRASVKRELERCQGNLDWVTQHLIAAGKPFVEETEAQRTEFLAKHGLLENPPEEGTPLYNEMINSLNPEYIKIYSAIDDLLSYVIEFKKAIDVLDSNI